MAIEDGYALACDLADAVAEAREKEAALQLREGSGGSGHGSISTHSSSSSPFSALSAQSPPSIDIAKVLRGYERQRIPRAAARSSRALVAAGDVVV